MQRSVRHFTPPTAFSTTPIHHVRPVTAPTRVKMTSRRSYRASWLWCLAVGFVRRPMLALTLGIAALLLFSTMSEASAATHLMTQVHAAQQTNDQLQVQLTQTAAQIQHHTAPPAIVAAAERLGWVMTTPQP